MINNDIRFKSEALWHEHTLHVQYNKTELRFMNIFKLRQGASITCFRLKVIALFFCKAQPQPQLGAEMISLARPLEYLQT